MKREIRKAIDTITREIPFMECECGQKFCIGGVSQHTSESTYDYGEVGTYYVWIWTGAEYCPFCGEKVSWDYDSSKQTKIEGEKDE